VKQLTLELGSDGVPATPLQLTPELQERLVALMADALQAVVDNDPKPQEEEARKDDDE